MIEHEKVKKELLELPARIKEQSEVIANLLFEIEKKKYRLELTRNDELQLVLSATEGGKPKFSNEQARKLALDQILRESETYSKLLDSTAQDELQLRREKIFVEYLQNQFRACLALLNCGGNCGYGDGDDIQ